MVKEKLTVTVSEAAEALGISRGLAYEMVRQSKLPALRFGRRILIPRLAIQQLLEETSASVRTSPDAPKTNLKSDKYA